MDPSQIYSQVCYFYFQHQCQLNIKHGHATNWFSCLATIEINKESTSIWNSDSITMTQPYGSVPRGICDLLRKSQPMHQRYYSFNTLPNTSKRSAKEKKKKKLTKVSVTSNFIELVQRTPFRRIQHQFPSTRHCFSSSWTLLHQHQYRQVPRP